MADKNSNSGVKGDSKPRLLAIGVLGLFVGLAIWAHFDVIDRSESELRARAEGLEYTANVVNLLYLAEEARIDSELARLRTELRAQDVWGNSGAVGSSARSTADSIREAVDEDEAIEGRRLDALLRRSLAGNDSFAALQLVVAGHDGLSVLGFERGDAGAIKSEWDADQREGLAKALWYADEVDRAVAASGRRVERGDLSFEGAIERPLLRAAIGLHEPGGLVQGALVASVDLVGFGQALSLAGGQARRVELVSVAGRALDPTTTSERAGHLEALVARVLGGEGALEPFEVGDRLVLGRPLAPRDGEAAQLVALIETETAETGLAAWMSTPWPAALAVALLLAVAGFFGLLRTPARQDARAGQAGLRKGMSRSKPTPTVASAQAEPIHVSKERFALRGWLADIRSCLEREAAKRGLGLDLRVERALPDEADGDAAWLGGLVVAMGREALDATPEERLAVRVFEESSGTLRIELAAGEVELLPVHGMQAVADSVGGRFETGQGGEIALVVPELFA